MNEIDPVVSEMLLKMRGMIADARARFHADVDAILDDAKKLAVALGNAIGEVSSDEALTAWKLELRRRCTPLPAPPGEAPK